MLVCAGLLFSTLVPETGRTATVPGGAELTISFEYKDNGNQLRSKGSGYAIKEDGYAATIWIEGPYDPAVPCSVVSFERKNIQLTRVISYFAYGNGSAGIGPGLKSTRICRWESIPCV